MPTILSTKKLTTIQKKPFSEAGFKVMEHDFITILAVNFEMPQKIKNAIFTSQNAVKQVMSYGLKVMSCYCVGEKTKRLLEKNGMKVVAWAEYGKDLAAIIVNDHPGEQFTFFCGDRRRDELPTILKKNNVPLEEIEVYKTILNPKHFEQKFDGILFFSPSAVESFCRRNALKGTTTFCIGRTTASAAKKYTDKIVISEKPTVESLVAAVSMHNFVFYHL